MENRGTQEKQTNKKTEMWDKGKQIREVTGTWAMERQSLEGSKAPSWNEGVPVLLLLGGRGDQADDSEGLGPVLHRNQKKKAICWVIMWLNAQ